MPLDWVKYVAANVRPLIFAFWRTLTFRAPFEEANPRELALSVVGTAAMLGMSVWAWGPALLDDAKWAFLGWFLVWLVLGGLFRKLPSAPIFGAFVFSFVLLLAPAPMRAAEIVAPLLAGELELENCDSGEPRTCVQAQIDTAQGAIMDLRRHVTNNGLRYCAERERCHAQYLRWVEALPEQQRQQFVELRARAEARVSRVNATPAAVHTLMPRLALLLAPFAFVLGFFFFMTIGSMAGVLGARTLGVAATLFSIVLAIGILAGPTAYRVGRSVINGPPPQWVSPLSETAWEPNASFETLTDLYRVERRWREMWSALGVPLDATSPCRLVIRVRPDGYATPGATISSAIAIKNAGREPCNDVHLQVEPPREYALIAEPLPVALTTDALAATAPLEPGFYQLPAWDEEARLLRWLTPILEPNQEASAIWSGTIASDTACSAVIEHRAHVSSAEYNEYEIWVQSPIGRTDVGCGNEDGSETAEIRRNQSKRWRRSRKR